MTEEAKKYIRTILEYAEWFDGAQEAIGEAFGAPNTEDLEEYDEWYAKHVAPFQEEVRRFLYDE